MVVKNEHNNGYSTKSLKRESFKFKIENNGSLEMFGHIFDKAPALKIKFELNVEELWNNQEELISMIEQFKTKK